jgi:hypothetical protein
MTHSCSKCQINWASLWGCVQGDELYEVCPECSTDMFLGSGTEDAGFIKCPFTGKIINVKTKEVLNIPGPVYKPGPTKEIPEKETYEQIEQRELAALDAYHKSGNHEEYFTTYRNAKS